MNLFIFFFCLAFQVKAEIPVSVNMGSFEGTYQIDGRSWNHGSETFQLPSGTHTLSFVNGASLTFDVMESGEVISHRPESAHGSLKELAPRVTSLTIHPGSYKGRYTLLGHPLKNGVQTFTIIENLPYRLITDVGGAIGEFTMASSGKITTAASGLAPSAFRLDLKTVSLKVNPARYKGFYLFGNDSPLRGAQEVVAIEGAHHRLRTFENGTIVNFSINNQGAVDIATYGHRNVESAPYTITFRTVQVFVDPAKYEGTYGTGGLWGFSGPIAIHLIEGAEHRLSTDLGASIVDFKPLRSPNGKVSLVTNNQAPVTARGPLLRFQTVDVDFNPSLDQDYELLTLGRLRGPQKVSLIPRVENRLHVDGEVKSFFIARCAPQNVEFADMKFALSCKTKIPPFKKIKVPGTRLLTSYMRGPNE